MAIKQSGDSSVEEILESIKKVIARDNRESAAQQKRQREKRDHTPAIADEGGTVSAEAVPTPQPAEDVLDLASAAEYLDPEDDPIAPAESPLVTEQARSSMRESLAALAVMSEPGASPQIVRSGETSLEGMTRDLLRPALAEWLDKHLPAMVEDMVSAEIARIVGKKS